MRTKKGIVTSTKQDKTAVVTVHAYKTHPKYKKRYRVSTKFHTHDPENSLKEGDLVIIGETKPVSKLKRWKLIENLGSQEQQSTNTVKKQTKAEPKKEVTEEKAEEKAEETAETK